MGTFRCLLFAAVTTFSVAATAAPYRLDLEVNPAAPFPFLRRFGTIDVSVFPGGVHAESTLFEGYSRNGSSQVTLLSPYSRVFSDVKIEELRRLLLTLSGSKSEVISSLPELPIAPIAVRGTVRGIPATRYRVTLGPEAWLDVWTTGAVPKNPQFHTLEMQFVSAISRSAARAAERIPGMPVYVELKTRRFDKVPLLRMKELHHTNEGEEDALSTGRFYLRSPILELFLK